MALMDDYPYMFYDVMNPNGRSNMSISGQDYVSRYETADSLKRRQALAQLRGGGAVNNYPTAGAGLIDPSIINERGGAYDPRTGRVVIAPQRYPTGSAAANELAEDYDRTMPEPMIGTGRTNWHKYPSGLSITEARGPNAGQDFNLNPTPADEDMLHYDQVVDVNPKYADWLGSKQAALQDVQPQHGPTPEERAAHEQRMRDQFEATRTDRRDTTTRKLMMADPNYMIDRMAAKTPEEQDAIEQEYYQKHSQGSTMGVGPSGNAPLSKEGAETAANASVESGKDSVIRQFVEAGKKKDVATQRALKAKYPQYFR